MRIRMWDISRSQIVQTYEGHKSSIHDVAWSPDGQYIASACDNRTFKLWSVATGVCVVTYEAEKESAWIRSVTWSPDSRYIAYGQSSGAVHIQKLS